MAADILGFLKSGLLILEVIFLFGILVIAHEYGHFITAKLSGMRVDEFAIGFGKKLFSWKRGETLYSVNIVPLGGYNRIYGMDVEDEEEQKKRKAKAAESVKSGKTKGPGLEELSPDYSIAPKDDPRAFVNRPVYQRFAVIISGPIANLLVAVLVVFLMGITIGFPAAELGGVIPGGPASAAGMMAGDTITHMNGIRLSSTSDLHRSIAFSNGNAIHLSGYRGNLDMEWTVIPQTIRLVDSHFCGLGFVFLTDGTVIYNLPGSPSERAGLQPGDIITGVDGLRFPSHNLNVESGSGIMDVRVFRGYKQVDIRVDYFESEINRDNYSNFGFFYGDDQVVTHVIPNGIAYDAGLSEGDTIVGGQVQAWSESVEGENIHTPRVTTLEIESDGATRKIRLDPDPAFSRIQVFMDDAAIPVLVGLPHNHRLSQAGIKAGDEIVSIEGVPTPNGITAFLEFERHIGRTVTILALSSGEERAYVVPIPSETDINGLNGFFSGLHFKTRYYPSGAVSSMVAGISKTKEIAGFIFKTIAMLISGQASINELAGPVGIATITYEAASSGLVDLINIMVLLSVNLAIFNLLPFPALDGGRLFFMVPELILRRQVVTVRVENIIHIAGFLLLILFALFVTYHDVVRIIFPR